MSLGALLLVLAAAPRRPEPLVEVPTVAPRVVVALRYATHDNFMHKQVYPADARCLLAAPGAEKLRLVSEALEPLGLRLYVYDAYRPLSVQWELWKVMPKVGWVADPKTGSHHNRGAAIDLTLATADGTPVEMPSDYDYFGQAAHHWFQGGTATARKNRDLLREVMEAAGFKRNPMEWWHYELFNPFRYPLRDDPFSVAAGDAGVPGR